MTQEVTIGLRRGTAGDLRQICHPATFCQECIGIRIAAWLLLPGAEQFDVSTRHWKQWYAGQRIIDLQ
jgi:hypothetical protein